MRSVTTTENAVPLAHLRALYFQPVLFYIREGAS